MNRFLTRLAWSLLGLIVLLLVALVVARTLFTRYLHSEAFRQTLSQGAANALHASHADFSPLDFDTSMVYGENFRATREDGGGFSSLNADQLRAEFDWHGLLHHTVQIDELSVQRLEIAPPVVSPADATLPPTSPSVENAAPLTAAHPGWTVDLRKASIAETNWHWSTDPAGGITGSSLTLTPDGHNAWLIDAQGGKVQQTGWPTLTLDSASMRWQNPTLYINTSSLSDGAARISVSGSIETRQSLDLQLNVENLDVNPFLTPDWRQRLSGRVSGRATVQGPLGVADPGSSLSVSGSFTLLGGQLTALPILDEIGTFTHTERFRTLELTHATADFTHTANRLEIRNMIVETEGLIRVEGSYTVENGDIDGTFQVGLTSATLQWIPGSQESVFTDSHDGYHWTPMRLTGPVAHPTDDLTPRLVAAMGNSVLHDAQGVEGTVKKAAQGALDLILH